MFEELLCVKQICKFTLIDKRKRVDAIKKVFIIYMYFLKLI